MSLQAHPCMSAEYHGACVRFYWQLVAIVFDCRCFVYCFSFIPSSSFSSSNFCIHRFMFSRLFVSGRFSLSLLVHLCEFVVFVWKRFGDCMCFVAIASFCFSLTSFLFARLFFLSLLSFDFALSFSRAFRVGVLLCNSNNFFVYKRHTEREQGAT